MSLRPVALAFALTLSGCVGQLGQQLQDIAKQANSLQVRAASAEALLAEVCERSQLNAIDESKTRDEAADRLSAIQSRCRSAWAAYDEFRLTWFQLADAIDDAQRDATKLSYVLVAMRSLASAEVAFISAVEELVHGQGGN